MHEAQPLCGRIRPTAIFYFDSDLELIHFLCQDVVNLGEKLAAFSVLGARTAFN